MRIAYAVLILYATVVHARLAPFQSLDPFGHRTFIDDTGLVQNATRPSPRASANDWIGYPVIGCFDNNEPFDNAALELPQDPAVIDTNFLLFTRETATTSELLHYSDNDKSITGSRYNSSRWLRIIVHGFTNNRDSPWIPRLTTELLQLKDVNQTRRKHAENHFDRFLERKIRCACRGLGSWSEISLL